MKIWYDLEFIERGRDLPMELISVGMVREDNEMLYLINADVSLSQIARHVWLALNVWPTLPLSNPNENILAWDTEHVDYPRVVALDTIASKVLEFCTSDGEEPELWAYYGAYDHVILAQSFGTMAELPPGMPMFTNDIVQEWKRQGCPQLPPQHHVQHHALEDALWVREAHKWLELNAGVNASLGAPRLIVAPEDEGWPPDDDEEIARLTLEAEQGYDVDRLTEKEKE
jgi:hypothetical protein